MLESFWGHCERVQEQTTEVNVSRSSEFSNSFLFLLDCGILLAIKVRLEAQTHLQRREIKIMMSIFPCFAPSLFPLPGSVCLIVSENIIYSGRKPQAKVGGGRKKKACTHWPGGWFLRSVRLRMSGWRRREVYGGTGVHSQR